MSENPSKDRVSSQRRGPGGPGGPPMGRLVEKPKDFKGGTKKLFSYLKPYRVAIFIVGIFAAVSTVFSIVGPKILAQVTDELVSGLMVIMTGGEGGIDFEFISGILLLMLGLYVLSTFFSYVQGRLMAGVSTRVSYDLRNALMAKINKLPLSYFHKTSHGEVLSRITNDVDTLSQSLNQSISQLISSLTALIGVTVMMLTISPLLTLVAMVMIPVSAVVVLLIVKQSQKHFKNQQKYLGSVNGEVEETYGGHLVVKAFNGEKKALEQFDKENEQLYNSARKAMFLSGIMMPLMGFVGNLGYVLICIVGGAMAATGSLTVGGIQAFINYVRSFTQPITQLANISNQFQSMIAASERVFEFLAEAEESEYKPKLQMKDIKVNGEVRFDHVRFGYEGTNVTVINDFSASVKPGQKIAIVGPTGAGKTTMVKLLMRFHDLNGGAIYVDGHNQTDFTRRDLRSEFGMVLQDTWLFSGTIMDNIRYGRLDATEKEVIEAARAAQVDHFIRTLPGAYQMELNEESTNISQGQKQLLTIARAILANSKILILDEATSNVDTRTEILIQRAMDNLMKGRTSFIIAHRLSTIRNADLILVMSEGDIVEQGNHQELMELGGFYAKLYNSQFERVS